MVADALDVIDIACDFVAGAKNSIVGAIDSVLVANNLIDEPIGRVGIAHQEIRIALEDVGVTLEDISVTID